MGNKICSFFGHRNVENKEELFENVLNFIENLILNEQFSVFLFGRYGEFDETCHRVVSKLKEKYPFIERIYCYSDEKQFLREKRKGEILESAYERFLFLPLEYDYWYTRIYYRNCKMVDDSDFVVFYAEKRVQSGAYKILEYAIRKKKRLYNLY
ncbi:MAG: hypothetical protein IJW64_03990 [Clostridia bacterium]|nr:hypothetical protein [Clostridia bacterium]